MGRCLWEVFALGSPCFLDLLTLTNKWVVVSLEGCLDGLTSKNPRLDLRNGLRDDSEGVRPKFWRRNLRVYDEYRRQSGSVGEGPGTKEEVHDFVSV